MSRSWRTPWTIPGRNGLFSFTPHSGSWWKGTIADPHGCPGSAGTGKTIVALHRAVFLARTNPDARVLLTTFSDSLANALKTRLRRLISHEPRLGERLEVHAMNAIGRRLYEGHLWWPQSRHYSASLGLSAESGEIRQILSP